MVKLCNDIELRCGGTSGEQDVQKKGPHQTDIVVGRNIRLRRLAKSMSQTALAERLGITFQQIQKYEKGVNRVGASRLMQIAEALDVPVHAFFDGAGAVAIDDASPLELIADPQALRVARAFAQIREGRLRRSVMGLIEDIAARRSGAGSAKT